MATLENEAMELEKSGDRLPGGYPLDRKMLKGVKGLVASWLMVPVLLI